MAKKKKQYPNERRNNIITGAAFGAFVALLIGLLVYNVASKNWIVKVDGATIRDKPFKVAMYQEKTFMENLYAMYGMDSSFWYYPSDESETSTYGMDAAMNSAYELFYQHVSLKEAERLGLTLTDEWRTKAREGFDEFMDLMTPTAKRYAGMSEKNLLRHFENTAMRQVLFEHIADTQFTLDEAALAASYDDYIKANRDELEQRNVNFILAETPAEAEEALERAKNGESIYDLIKEFCSTYTYEECDDDDHDDPDHYHPEDWRMMAEPLSMLLEYDLWFLNEGQKQTLYGIGEGEFSEIMHIEVSPGYSYFDEDEGVDVEIPAEERWLIVRIDEIDKPDYDEIYEEFRKNYIDQGRSAVFSEYFEAKLMEYNPEFNWDKIFSIDIAALPM
jgi:hypothetical protein